MLSKKLLVAAALAGFSLIGFSATADAALPGYYVGGQLGWNDTHTANNFHTSSGTTVDDSGLGGRIFGGYQVNPNLAFELGYARYSNTNVKTSGHGTNTILEEEAVDFVAKGIMPINDAFSAYGKVGPAYVRTTGQNGFDGDAHKICPEFGLGVSYDITPHVPIDLSWNHIQKMGSNSGSNYIRNVDFVAVGAAYNFG